MGVNLDLSQKMTQAPALSQQARIGLAILPMNIIELGSYLRAEISDNPMFEDDDSGEFDAATSSSSDEFDRHEEYANDYSDLPTSASYDPDYEKKRLFRERSIIKEETLEERLLKQLGMHFDGLDFDIGEFIIGNLDEDGYFRMRLEQVDARFEAGLDRIERVRAAIRMFEPIGSASRDIRECLMSQLESRGLKDSSAYAIVRDHLEDLSRKKYALIARKLDIDEDDAIDAHKEIASLEPKPGRAFAGSQAIKIIPDLTLVKEDDRYYVALNNEYMPTLKISAQYAAMYKKPGLDPETKKYIKQRRERAKCLISALEQSQETIRRIAEYIVNYQKDFVEHGEGHIKPLKLTDVATALGFNESTVSRATTSKFLQTEMGVLSLKKFFSVGVKQTDGSTRSAETIRSRIKDIIEQELASGKPLSDQKIVDRLKTQGVDIARRTVTKYRKTMKILASGLRR
jgi:RNA polymerase sigma-54 factor